MGISPVDAGPAHPGRTVDELQPMVRRRAVGASFALKIFRMLTFTADNPAFRSDVGVFWCGDGRLFGVHKDTVAEFWALKPNSVNTNLRDFGFRIQPHLLPKPPLEPFHNTKCRCGYHALITKAMPEHKVARIGIALRVDISPEIAVQSGSKQTKVFMIKVLFIGEKCASHRPKQFQRVLIVH
jgi:hypothetical protein